MSTQTEKAIEAERATEYLRRVIDRDSLIHTRTEHGRGETDHVRVYVIRPEPPHGRQAILDITYYVARAAGRRMDLRGIRYGGAQYSKGLEAADDCWRAVFDEPIPQLGHWRELH